MTTPETTCVFIRSTTGHYQPIVNLRCECCGLLVDVTLPPADENGDGEWTIFRVGGDSANGYEVYHQACINRAVNEDPHGYEYEAESFSAAPNECHLRLVQ